MLPAMKLPAALLVLIAAFLPPVGMPAAGENPAPEEKQEVATARLELARPGNGGVFAKTVRDFRREKFDARPFEWKEVDEKIDTWFEEAKTRFPGDFQKHGANWDHLRAQTKKQAREALAPVEQAWKDSVSRAATAFRASEAAFYARKPALRIRGTYRYLDGQRDPSTIMPAWELDPPELLDAAPIAGSDTHDTGPIVLKASGLGHPVVSLKCVWTVSLEASIDPESRAVRTAGRVQSPVIEARADPRFDGKSHREIATTWKSFDKSSTQAGPIKLTIGDSSITSKMGIGLGFTYPALDSKLPMPTLRAGE